MRLIKNIAIGGLLAGLAIHSVFVNPASAETQVIKISASKFHFTPDHITLVEGQPVKLQLTSTDRAHGFMIRPLQIDTDIKPGKVTEMTVTPATAGTFKAICDHYCGIGHSGMKMTVVVKQQSSASRLTGHHLADAMTNIKSND
ncbi:MAG TPA: cupredoxin domain-containing protein [Candidatus Binataceae bacterium]|nr:cupredoxin domain-containing protein [Candidatus Binataceae bacterium]